MQITKPIKTPPLRRNWFHILLALADRDVHGSEIARDVLGQTDGGVRLWPATLYRTLEEIVAAGLITKLSGPHHPEGVSARRRYYRITARGRRELAAAADHMARWSTDAHRRLGNG